MEKHIASPRDDAGGTGGMMCVPAALGLGSGPVDVGWIAAPDSSSCGELFGSLTVFRCTALQS